VSSSLIFTAAVCHETEAGIEPKLDVPLKLRRYADEARKAVKMCKYPPMGTRSMTGAMPLFNMESTPLDRVISFGNESGSSVFAMIESHEAVEAADDIAAVEGVDVLLIGSFDLTIECGIGGQFGSEAYRTLVEKVAKACRTHGKTFGIAGIYDDAEKQDWLINTLGVRFMLVQQDITLIAAGGRRAIAALPSVKSP
jgi:2-keto-3-deoxy-L-rhamnonate aldolase RhmA